MPRSTLRSASWSLALLVSACASREVPTRYASSSAAAPDSAPGHTLSVTRALASEPPLPGESTQGWSGLSEQQPNQAAPGAHQHGSHHQHGAAQPEQKKPAPPPATENAPAAQEHQGHHHGH